MVLSAFAPWASRLGGEGLFQLSILKSDYKKDDWGSSQSSI